MRKSNPLFATPEDMIVVGAVVAAGIGLVTWALWPKPAAAATAPSGAALVTTPSYVQTAQSLVNSFITAGQTHAANPTGVPSDTIIAALAVLTPCTANGNPADPTFKVDLAAVQVAVNALMALPAGQGMSTTQSGAQWYLATYKTPWVPLRTDGVLDGYTYQALAMVSNF